ncbi:MAG: hypothetical protein M1831_000646 [Alyxoria varia]|nr:MAG: hypothetical protein M1831_000646 [Alyxoria varia]
MDEFQDALEAQTDGVPESKSTLSPPLEEAPPGSILTGKQEHYLKRELISRQTQYEISELSSPTALQRFGAPFSSDAGEVAPEHSELPFLRYIFVHHVRNFPFLDQAREQEFWQDKLQKFLESFATKHISSSEDRLEETKRRKLAQKAEKVVELMMVSGIPTASGYEERIRFSEMEVVDRGANEQGLIANIPEGREINGWDVNVAGVRYISVKRTVRYHTHAEFLLRVKGKDAPERFVGRRYGDFARMHRQLRVELPGKVLPPLPRKNKANTSGVLTGREDNDSDSVSSVSTQGTAAGEEGGGFRSYIGLGGSHKRNISTQSVVSTAGRSRQGSPTPENSQEHVMLFREDQRVSLRAFLRTILQNERIASSKTLRDFLTRQPVTPNREESEDIAKRKRMDEKRIEEGQKFYEIARKRAKELDEHMEKFRREIVESNGLTKLFREIRVKDTIADLSPGYQKFAEWLRIEVAATIYHLFLAEDNSPDLFAQAKRIHSLVPYATLKNVIRFTNPAAVMKGVLDLFLAQPLGARSLMQRIFSMALNDGVRATQQSIDSVSEKIQDEVLCNKIQQFTMSDEAIKDQVRKEAADEQVDLLVTILRSSQIEPALEAEQIEKIFNAYVAWTSAVENVSLRHPKAWESPKSGDLLTTKSANQTDQAMRQGAELFAHLKQLLKLYTRQRDKAKMMFIIEEPVTLQLFRDLFTIFYEPLVRVYKSANVYSSVTDFAAFADDTIKVVESAQRHDVGADPNRTVQAFIDLCERHQDDFYKFVHEVHTHDNGLFDKLMGWLEGILEFLRHGPIDKKGQPKKIDMNALFEGAVDAGVIDKDKAIQEIDRLIEWQMARKKWHHDKTRRKMAAEDSGVGGKKRRSATMAGASLGGVSSLKSGDFGIDALDIQDYGLDEGVDDDSDFELYYDDEEAIPAIGTVEEEEAKMDEEALNDPIGVERRRRRIEERRKEALRGRKGEPAKPSEEELKEVSRLMEGFVGMCRGVLAE